MALIHGGRIRADDLLGDPDLLIRDGDRYLPADVKSGSAEEASGGEGEGKPKAAYAVQVALYADVLMRLDRAVAPTAEIWDVDGRRVTYDLAGARGARSDDSWWELYRRTRDAVRTPGSGCLARWEGKSSPP